MIGEAEVGDPVGRRVHKLPPDRRRVHGSHSLIGGVVLRVRVLGAREGGREGSRFENENE